MADIGHLRWRSLQGEIISFERKKTKRSLRSNPIKIIILRNETINKLIDNGASKKTNHNALINRLVI